MKTKRKHTDECNEIFSGMSINESRVCVCPDRYKGGIVTFGELIAAAKHFKKRYESIMHSEYDFTRSDWSYKREGDNESIKYARVIDRADTEVL